MAAAGTAQVIALIPLSLLLLAATPLPTNRSQQAEESTGHQGVTEPTQAPTPNPSTQAPTPNPQPLVAKGDGNRDQPTAGPTENAEDWRKGFAPSTWSNWALFVAAVIAAGVGLYTLRAIERQARIARVSLIANRRTANAAKRSAEAMDATLRASRPVVVVANFILANCGPAPEPQKMMGPSSWLKAYFDIENAGMSPAMIKSARAKLVLLPDGALPEIRSNYRDCRMLYLTKTVLGAGERLAPQKGDLDRSASVAFDEGYISPENYLEVIDGRSCLLVYGLIQYRSLTEERLYDTPFLWIVVTNSARLENGEITNLFALAPGPDHYNKST